MPFFGELYCQGTEVEDDIIGTISELRYVYQSSSESPFISSLGTEGA
jgi:hypothetical protein